MKKRKKYTVSEKSSAASRANGKKGGRIGYDIAFRRRAVNLANQPEISPTKAAASLGIGRNTLMRWLSKYEETGDVL